MSPLETTGTCWDLAVSLAAHHAGGDATRAEPVSHSSNFELESGTVTLDQENIP